MRRHDLAVLAEVVQDACLLLECRQPLDLCAAIAPVQDAAALVPRLERFLGDVCSVRARGWLRVCVCVQACARAGASLCAPLPCSARSCMPACVPPSLAAPPPPRQAVFQRGLTHVPPELRQDNPQDVPAVLAAWIAELGCGGGVG